SAIFPGRFLLRCPVGIRLLLCRLVCRIHFGFHGSLHVTGDGDDPVALIGFGEGHTLGGATGEVHFADGGAHDLALLHDHQHLVIGIGDQGTHQVASFGHQVRDLDTQTTAALHAVLRDLGALTEATFGDHEQVAVVPDHGHGQQRVVVAEFHAGHARGGPA